MRAPEDWRPSRLIRDSRTGEFKLNKAKVYGGSLYLSELQRRAYLPLFQEHLRGRLLDVGCGPVPYHEAYSPYIESSVCVDYPGTWHGQGNLDIVADLNAEPRLPLDDASFDSVLASDMIVHMKRPDLFLGEVARVLKPGGKALITSTFVNWIGEFPLEHQHPTGLGLRTLAEDAGLEVIHLESFGGHADVLMDTLNKFFPEGLMNKAFLAFARLVELTGWPARDRARTRDRYALGNAMVARKP
ncbi:MAG: methyltransferase domain-containing protein [Flavobacteriales bacterium]|nr:methyltransferase domain-containing protein [Flavobacteriales bacterium]